MKILTLCNNYGSYKDGIGDYTQKISEQLNNIENCQVEILSSNTIGFNAIKRLLSVSMTKKYLEAMQYVKNNDVDIVSVEYPFTEWSPFIIIGHLLLKKCCRKNNIPMVLSLHEYTRVHPFRKRMIEFLVKKSDFVFVTEERIKDKLLCLNHNIFIRKIPSNIRVQDNNKNIPKIDNSFVFFGLINSNKAFDEMIEGWKMYKKEDHTDSLLTIISSSKIDELYNIESIRYEFNASETRINEIMAETQYSILPIKPSINLNNGTLKTSTLFKCIPIGIFSEEIKNEYSFFINMQNYSVNEFYNIFKKRLTATECILKRKSMDEFNTKFDISNIAKEIYDKYKKIVQRKI